MYDLIDGTIAGWLGVDPESKLAVILTYIAVSIIVIAIGFIADKVTKTILLKVIGKLVSKTKTTADDHFYEKRVFHRLAHIAPAMVIYIFAPAYANYAEWIRKGSLVYIVLIVVLVAFAAIDASNEIYNSKSFAKNRPIKGMLQIIKIVLVIFGSLFIITIVTDSTTVTALLGGLGGLTAVLLLIFRDSILGFVAGVQLSTDNLLSIGDWIEMPKYDADGEVVDIALTKIVVRNWDKTYTTIPAYKFLEDSFKNWKGMTAAGGRRIKRSLSLNMNSIKFLSDQEIKRLKDIHLIDAYLENKVSEIDAHNKSIHSDKENRANGRHLTNIGTFRAYMQNYLENHPSIHHEGFTIMVRQLAPTDKGVAIELYCFTNDIAWANYEGIMADIFDHMMAVLKEFDLQVYQAPTGDDFKQLMRL